MSIIDANTLFGFWPYRQVDLSPEHLLAGMDRHGVARAATLSARGILYDATAGNDETLALCQREPRFLPVGTVDPRRPGNYGEEIARRAREGFRLFHLFPEHQAWQADQPAARRLLAALDAAGMAVMLSGPPGIVAGACRGLSVPVILAGAHTYTLSDVQVALEECPNLYLETRLLHGPDVLAGLVRQFGAERLIYGSGAPLLYMASSLGLVQHAAITEAERTAILGGNLARLLGGEG